MRSACLKLPQEHTRRRCWPGKLTARASAGCWSKTNAAHADCAVAEPVHASESPHSGLLAHEVALAQHLRTLDKGRLEQEFLPVETVAAAFATWAG